MNNNETSNIAVVRDLQRRYDELNADCKDLCNAIINWVEKGVDIKLIEFNDNDGLPSVIYRYLMDNNINNLTKVR